METTLAILFVGLLVFLAHTFVALFNRTRIPDVLFLILTGLIIGPVLKIVTPEDFGRVGHVFIIVALVIILFEGGMQRIRRVPRLLWNQRLVRQSALLFHSVY